MRDKGPWQYYVDFVAFPLAVIAVAALEGVSLAWFGVAVIGFVLFTFAEYWTHRLILHRLFWHATHERHHTHAHEYVVFAVWLLPLFFLVLLAISVDLTGSGALWCGFATGYVWFLTWHHMLHHRELEHRPWVARYAAWHNQHHMNIRCNYGITNPVWDYVFGTYKPLKRR
jgi:sterol desaturase/sphingolipid hydroxylase (fatty acid hydroxylase superfamily)